MMSISDINKNYDSFYKAVYKENLKYRIIITGDVQSGKSTLAENLIKKLRKKNINLCGILAKGLWKNNKRHGFDLIDLKSNKITPLAVYAPLDDNKTNNSKINVCFKFFQKGIDAGKKALSIEKCKNSKIIFIDEIGKLELKGLGWAKYLKELIEIPDLIHIWIVRESLLEKVCEIWKIQKTYIINVNDDNALEKLTKICLKEQ
ncbi:MAG: hypothetical protein B6I26_02630 [Desulfobacteraceae bacterium 4572_130]|nr:MAG: hypothetical protein B6I26_02630 [Desulfobacteraceae bacterium 4572_130]